MSRMIDADALFAVVKGHHDLYKDAINPADKARRDECLQMMCDIMECCSTNRLRREDCEAMDCVYLDLEGHGCIHQLIRDALALLKAQEAVKPIRDINGIYYCGNCDTICVGYEVEFTHSIIKVENYCHKCGRKVKWDG